jgi:alkylated DNA repair dioxygenase AlkB
MRNRINIINRKGLVDFFPGFFSEEESDRYFSMLMKEIAWRQEPVNIFGKMIPQPRLTAWYGDLGKSYSYSGIIMHPQKWTNGLLEIRQRIEKAAPVIFNSALLNLYRDQKDSVGWHRDNEKSLGVNPVIASVSFGTTRRFLLRHYEDKSIKQAVELTPGSLLLMQGQTQQVWEHCIPRQTKASGARINITFRIIKEAGPAE